MTPTIHNVQQGSDEWRLLRCGLITASCMKLLITSGGKDPSKGRQASNEKSRAHLDDLLAQRITGYVEPSFISDDMARGHEDEPRMREVYERHTGLTVVTCGFMTAVRDGHTVGYSPDGLVGEDGLIEGKSRRQKYQVRTILNGGVPEEFAWQIQAGLYVSGRKWCDFISHCGGMVQYTHRVYPVPYMQETIRATVSATETWLAHNLETYARLSAGLPMTERATVTEEGYKWELEAD